MRSSRHMRAAAFICTAIPLIAANRLLEQANDSDVLDYINPLIGSQAGGNVFTGATLPYGMVKGR